MIPFKQKHRFYRKFVVVVLAIFLHQTLHPPKVSALTSGPAQPEFSKFQPVSNTNMVNEFTGDFTYNLPVMEIPGPNGGGYSLSLSYQSGTSPEEEASWVGYGWTLNPGAIIRQKRGFPDDWNGKNVTYWNKMPPNETISIGPARGLEAFSGKVGLQASHAVRYNNYKGFGKSSSVGLQLWKGTISLAYNVTDGEGSFSYSINPAGLLSKLLSYGTTVDNASIKTASSTALRGLNSINTYTGGVAGKVLGNLTTIGSHYGFFSSNTITRPTQITEYKGKSYRMSVGLMEALSMLQVGIKQERIGTYTRQTNVEWKSLPVYGYMYASKAKSESMMDYYIEKGSTYNKRDVFLGIPFSNADIFNIYP